MEQAKPGRSALEGGILTVAPAPGAPVSDIRLWPSTMHF